MNSIVTPKNVLEIVLKEKTKPLFSRPWENSTQEISFFVAVVSLLIGSVLGIVLQAFREAIVGYIAIGLIYLSIPSAILCQISVLWPSVVKLRHPERSLSESVIEQFDNDIDTISLLVRGFEKHHFRVRAR